MPGDFSFIENYNHKRLDEVRKDTIKGKQYIQIKITFIRGKQFEKTLPERFTISKKWNRDSIEPQVTNNIETVLKRKGKRFSDRNQASLTKFLNKMRFVYIPAIKDNSLFATMIKMLQDTVYKKKLSGSIEFEELMYSLHDQVAFTTKDLTQEFFKATGIESIIATPEVLDDLYESLKIVTRYEGRGIPLEARGDGIRVRYIPSILHYISTNSQNQYIWGFEEPENSLEYSLASKMANDFFEIYKKDCQIFLTTHSPAFIDLGTKDRCAGYRCYSQENETKVTGITDDVGNAELAEELGYAELLQQQYAEFQEMVKANKRMEEALNGYESLIKKASKPLLLTEGKTDKIILECAWEKLYGDKERCFEIDSCNLYDENQSGESAAGAHMLKTILQGIRHNNNRVTIGLFDNDTEGKKCFKLDANYIDCKDRKWKRHKNGKGYALLIPEDSDTSKIAQAGNLTSEFLFNKEVLFNENDHNRSILKVAESVTTINGFQVKRTENNHEYWYCYKIKDSLKLHFANEIVPELPKSDFHRFKQLFEEIIMICNDIEN